MSVMTKTTRALALLAEADELLEAAMSQEPSFGDPDKRDIREARNRTYEALRTAQQMFRGEQ